MCEFEGLNWSLRGHHGDADVEKKQIEMKNQNKLQAN